MRIARIGLTLLVLGCTPGRPPVDPAFLLDFQGPGRLAVIWHLGEPDELLNRRLVVYSASGARALGIEQPREVRWLSPAELLVGQHVAVDEPGQLPRTRLLRVRLDGTPPRPIGEPKRYYGAEPSPDGERLAVGIDVNDAGDSELEIWSLADEPPRRLARRSQNLDEPRWSDDGSMLLVSEIVDPGDDAEGPDLEGEDGGLSFAGQSVPFPRLFVLPSDLVGGLTRIHDGEREKPLASGGSLPAWWNEGGVYARQRGGLVRCKTPESGCELRYRSREGFRVFDARPGGPGRAYLLVGSSERRFEGLPTELRSVELDAGNARSLHPPRETAYPLDLDWIDTAPAAVGTL